MNRAAYVEECRARWSSRALVDAQRNWALFTQHHETLKAILAPFVRDCFVADLCGNQNPEGTLTAWLWICSEANPWIWDFCDYYQKCHLRRGLIAYCKQVIDEMRSSPPQSPGQFV